MTLHVVSDTFTTTQDAPTGGELPHFEGEQVHHLRGRLVSTSGLEIGDDPHRLDQTVRLLVIGRVTRVDHVVNDKTGELTRVETMKIVDALQVPWEAVSEYLDTE